MPLSALLLVNAEKPEAMLAADQVRGLIQRHGRLVGDLPALHGPLPSQTLESLRGVDLIVVLGGDGTLLSQARRCIALGAPLLGVNFGRLGFMAEFDVAALTAQAPEVLGEARFTTTDMPPLSARVVDIDGRVRFEGLALNDAVITAGPPFRMITLAISVDGQPGPTFHGDGVVVATPLGSTAYNLSAGGPILVPGMDALAVTPIAAHSLSFRPIVVAGSSRIEVMAQRVNSATFEAGTTLVLDGQVHAPIRTGDRIILASHDRPVRFVTNRHAGYWSRLIGKLEWAKSPRPPA